MIDLKKRLLKDKYNNDFSRKLIEAEQIFNSIFKVCGNKMEYGCGSYLIGSQKYDYSIDMYDKQKILYERSKNVNSVLEIGTYMGHSILIMLLANPHLHITAIDIDDTYSPKAIQLLQSKFINAKIDFIHGNSLNILPKINKKFDFFHIDGAHGNTTITQEFTYCKKLSSSNDFKLIFDDVEVCNTLQKNIHSSYNVIEHNTPNCINKNKYMHIKINSDFKKNHKENRKFMMYMAISFLKEFPSRLFRFLARKIEKNK